MIVDKQLVNKIKDYFDLNIYQTKVWIALLSKGMASAGQIAEASGVPRSRTYDVLESLEKKGFAIEKIGKPTQYLAVKPETVLEKLKRNSYKQAKERVEILEDLKDKEEFDRLKELHQKSLEPVEKREVSGAIKGKNDIHTHAREIASEASEEVLMCMPSHELLDKTRSFKKLFKDLEGSKAKTKLLINGSDEDLEKIKKVYNVEPEKTDLDSKFILVDRKQILFSLNNSRDDEEVAVWLNSGFFSNAFAQLVETKLGVK